MSDERMQKLEAAMRKVKMFVYRDGRPFAIADDPEQVNAIRDVLREYNDEEGSYSVGATPYRNAPGGPDYWDVGGWPKFSWDLAAEVAHEQSLAKGFRGVRWLA